MRRSRNPTSCTTLSIRSNHRTLHRWPGVLKALGDCKGLSLLCRTGVIGEMVSDVVNVFPVVASLLVAAAVVTDCARRILAGQEHVVVVRVNIPASTNAGLWLRLAGEPLSSRDWRWRRQRREQALFLGLPLVVTVLKGLLKMGQLSCLVHWSRWTHILRSTGANAMSAH